MTVRYTNYFNILNHKNRLFCSVAQYALCVCCGPQKKEGTGIQTRTDTFAHAATHAHIDGCVCFSFSNFSIVYLLSLYGGWITAWIFIKYRLPHVSPSLSRWQINHIQHPTKDCLCPNFSFTVVVVFGYVFALRRISSFFSLRIFIVIIVVVCVCCLLKHQIISRPK